MLDEDIPGSTCPIPIERYPRVLLAHGGGGRLMHELLERLFLTAFANPLLAQRQDAAVFRAYPNNLTRRYQ